MKSVLVVPLIEAVMNSKAWFCARIFSRTFILQINSFNHQIAKSSSLSSRLRKKLSIIAKDKQNLDMAKTVIPAHTNPHFVVSVEGNIGCGKTEMLNYFSNTQNCEVIQEPVEKWRDIQGNNALELMYQDPERWGMTLQTYIQLTMLKNHVLPQTKPVRLIERSIFSAKYCFVENLFRRGSGYFSVALDSNTLMDFENNNGKMKEIEFVILTEWFEFIIKTQNVHLDLIVYLRTDPEILHERIMKRCRPEEKGIPLDYLYAIHQMHEDWLVHKKFPCPAKVLIIDANSALEKMPELYEQNRNRIVQTFAC